MAIAPKIIVTIRDDKGKTATTEIKIPTGITLANMIEFAREMAILIDGITRGVIINVTIGIGIDLSALSLASNAFSDADVEEKGSFQFFTETGFYTTVNIPCWDDDDTVVGSDAVDEVDIDVAAFIAAMTDGIELEDESVVEPCDSREDDIVALVWAREKFRSSGKRAG